MTRQLGRGRRLFGAVAIAVVASGCGAIVSPAPASPGPCGTVAIARNPWVGYEADFAVVSYLLRHQLGCTVSTRQIDEISSWQFIASGGLDVILENWDHQDLVTKYIAVDKVALDAGPTGNEGTVGWFVPKYFVDANPDILTAKTNPQVLNRYADQFKTPQSGDKGQLLDGDPNFVTEDRAMVNGFGLNYRVVYAGSEAASDQAIQAAFDRQAPILAYYVEPNWFSTKVALIHIPLPAHTPGCDADPNNVACDYPSYDLHKVVSTAFARSGGAAYELIKRFSWTNAEQDLVAAYIADGHMSDDAAAAKWLDANTSRWQAWMP